MATPILTINLLGSFSVVDSEGNDRTPRGAKACAILTVLALSPERRRARAFLQDKCWSRSGPKQASDSLRQALSEIRSALGEHRNLLISKGRNVLLSDRVQVIAEHHTDGDLVEDLAVNDPEFETWIATERQAFLDRAPPVPVRKRTRRVVLCVRVEDRNRSPTAPLFGGTLSSVVAGDVLNRMSLDLTTSHEEADLTLALSVDLAEYHGTVIVELRTGPAVVWANAYTIELTNRALLECNSFRRVINDVSDAIVDAARLIVFAGTSAKDSANGLAAVNEMFLLSPFDLDDLKERLTFAYQATDHPVFLGWRGYSETFIAESMRPEKAEDAIERALDDIVTAMRAAPSNATILAAASHIHALLLREYAAAHEFAEKSLRLGPANPLALAFLGRAKTLMGDLQEGYELTNAARSIVGFGPYSTFITSLCSMNAMMAGHFSDALRLCEYVRRTAPGYKPPLRMLAPLYLLKENRPKARETIQELKRLDASFSLDILEDHMRRFSGISKNNFAELHDLEI